MTNHLYFKQHQYTGTGLWVMVSLGCCRAIDDEEDHQGEFEHVEGDFDEEGFPVIGTCRALYPYEGWSNTS